MSAPIRLRFAPSPTGFLHIGGVRTALFNWLYARRFGGKFLLRIEDTDLERSEDRYTQDILASMAWLGLNHDEEPIYQSKRLELYLTKARELVERGQAYYCTCTEEDVEKMRERALAEGRKPMYDRSCRGRNSPPPPGMTSVIRLAVPLEGSVAFDDLIRGRVEVSNSEIDDFVLIRSNGAPTYNLSVVIDDADSRMSHIVRGDDHINNTPKQVHLYTYLGVEPPKFAHLPMILGSDKKKLSKRHGAVSANQYRADGFLPEALLNFLARIGWSHGDQEVFSIEEMVNAFDFDHVQKASGVFNTEKLLWINAEHIKAAPPSRLNRILCEDFASSFSADALSRVQTPMGERLTTLFKTKIKTLAELAQSLKPYLEAESPQPDRQLLKWKKDASLEGPSKKAAKLLLDDLRARGEARSEFESLADRGVGHLELEPVFKATAEACGIKLGDMVQPVRLALCGTSASPSVMDLWSVMPIKWIERRVAQISEW